MMNTTVFMPVLMLGSLLSGAVLADDLLQPGDRTLAVGPLSASLSSYPPGEEPSKLIDADPTSKYLNQGGPNTGFIVTLPGGAAPVRSMEIATANDALDRDPTSFILYGTNDPVTSPDNSDGLNENWTEVASGPLSLPADRYTYVIPPVNITNDTAYSSYKMIFPTLNGGPLMQLAELEMYDQAGGFNGAGSLLISDTAPIIAVQQPFALSSYPPAESPAQAIDRSAAAKYLNFGKEGTGFIVVPSLGLTRIVSFVITTANDHESRDPTSYELYGTLDTVISEDNSDGRAENWTLIATGPLTLPVERLIEGAAVTVSATADYSAYKMIFPTVRDPAAPGADSMQIAEIQFDGVVFNPPEGDALITQGDRIVAINTYLGSRSFYDPQQAPSMALDGLSTTKYLNGGGVKSGFIVTPGIGATTVGSFRITTADDVPERDPAAWELYGTTDAITSADNSTGDAENWTLIDSGTVTLPADRETLGPAVSVANSTSYTSYRIFFTELKDDSAVMQIADIQFYSSGGSPFLSAFDPIIAVQAPVARSVYYETESPARCIDGDVSSKYMNYGGYGSGFIVMPTAPGTVVQRFTIVTAPDAENRDPASFELYGTMDPLMSVDNSLGTVENWILIDSGTLSLPAGRGVFSDSIVVQNTTAYRSYKMIFPTIKDPNIDDLMQIAEVQFRGVIEDPGPMALLSDADPIVAVNPRLAALTSYPPHEAPPNILDGDPNTKYLNYAGRSTGFIVTPAFGASTVLSFQLTTANDAEERDPADWTLYGTNDPITSEDNSAGMEENWTLIDSGTVLLPTARLTLGPAVAVTGATSFTSYRMVFNNLKDNAALMQVADVQLFTGPNGTGSTLLATGDPILAIGEQIIPVSSYPGHEGPGRALDGLIGSKYLNLGAAESGFIVTPSIGISTVTRFDLRTANDAPERDPTSYELYGTMDPITSPDNSGGTNETWTLISSGTVDLLQSRFQVGTPVTFSNTESFSSYKLLFPTLRAADAPSMQIAEAQFYGEAVMDLRVLDLRGNTTSLTLEWESEAGVAYEIYYTSDIKQWSTKLPGTVTGSATSTEHTFANPLPGAATLYLRVDRP